MQLKNVHTSVQAETAQRCVTLIVVRSSVPVEVVTCRAMEKAVNSFVLWEVAAWIVRDRDVNKPAP